MQKQSNIRILEILKYLYLRTDEDHPATVADIMEHLKGKGISTVRQTVYGDLEDIIAAGIDVDGNQKHAEPVFYWRSPV